MCTYMCLLYMAHTFWSVHLADASPPIPSHPSKSESAGCSQREKCKQKYAQAHALVLAYHTKREEGRVCLPWLIKVTIRETSVRVRRSPTYIGMVQNSYPGDGKRNMRLFADRQRHGDFDGVHSVLCVCPIRISDLECTLQWVAASDDKKAKKRKKGC